MVALADYNMFGTFRPYMRNLISDGHSTYLPQYNEFQKTLTEKKIAKGIYYDAAHLKVFENVNQVDCFLFVCHFCYVILNLKS